MSSAAASIAPDHRHAVPHPLPVAAVERLSDDAVVVTFDVPRELREAFRFRAGQHVAVRAPQVGDGERRSYSICAPATSGQLRIGVKRIPGGRFSTYALERLQPGEVLELMTPTGSFGPELDPRRARRYGAIAAGSGITPLLSILATALEVEPASSAVLVDINRTAASVLFLDELADLKDRYPERFRLLHVLTGEALGAEQDSGRLDAARLDRLLDSVVAVDEWYVCGPLPLTEMVRATLARRGVDPGQVHRELFHVGTPAPRRPAAPTPFGEGSRVTVLLDGRSESFLLPRTGPSVLAATLLARPDAPYACRNGVCGTCRARVVQGEVAMDTNYALEPDELARGVVLTCQSHPVSNRVVLDFDR